MQGKRTARNGVRWAEMLESRVFLSGSPQVIPEELFPGAVMLHEIDAPLQVTPSRSAMMLEASEESSSNLNGFDIVLKKGPNLSNNAAAAAAFEQAAQFFESFISDPVTIVIDAEVAALGSGIIGSTGSVAFDDTFANIRNAMVSDRAPDESIAASLPTLAQFTYITPPPGGTPYSIAGMRANRATMLALGYQPSNLDGPNSSYAAGVDRDMNITFSTNFSFDYDRSDGITAGQQDFVGVAIHEIAHGLGFVSEVDRVDTSTSFRALRPTPLDLYRLQPGQGQNNFTLAPRVLAPGNVQAVQVMYDGGIFDPTGVNTANVPGLGTGDVPLSTGVNQGDAHQASHWKDNVLATKQIGIMDPTSAGAGQQLNWLATDTRAMGLIGWDIGQVTPTPGTPDLVSSSDSGSSTGDNVTALDNSSSSKKLQFLVGGTVAGATVTIYSGSTAIGSATASGSSTTVTTNGTIDLADGTRSITARQSEQTEAVSNPSGALNVTIDTASPTADIIDVSPDPRTSAVNSINIVFSRAVNNFNLADLSLARDGGPNLLTASQTLTTSDNITFTLNNLSTITDTTGVYQLTLTAAGSGIVDSLAGNSLVSNATESWTHALPAWISASLSAANWRISTGVLNVTGSATIVDDPGSVNASVNVSGGSAVLTISPTPGNLVRLAALSLTNNARASLASLEGARMATNHRVLLVQSGAFSVDSTSTLDLADNDLIVDYSTGDLLTAVESMVRAGYHGGDWLGKRLVSSVARDNANFQLGIADNQLLPVRYGTAQGGDLFDGIDLDDTAIIVKFTHQDDLNLDGLVNGDDAQIFGTNYDNGTSAFWSIGDVDHDGFFTTDDVQLFSVFYDASLPAV